MRFAHFIVLIGTLMGCSGSDSERSASGGTAGCADDTDCPDDAFCDDGRCVEPATTSEGEATSGTGGHGGSIAIGGATSSGPGEPSSPDAPIFLSFGTSVSTLTEGDSVTFTAVLTDPQGIDDLIGGTLKDENGTPYGAFATSGEEGAYETTIDWSDIENSSPIFFASGQSLKRSFLAEFFDAEGNSATQAAALTLVCAGALAACDGKCTDTQTSESDCGGCGVACSQGQGCIGGQCACSGGSTLCGARCANLQYDPSNCGACGVHCMPGERCDGGQCFPTG
jgi:hypothetical protein